MRFTKKMILRIFFALEGVIFMGMYIWGACGMRAILKLEETMEQLHKETLAMEHEIAILENDIANWHKHPFYKEKVAREQLQMARSGEEIYYLN